MKNTKVYSSAPQQDSRMDRTETSSSYNLQAINTSYNITSKEAEGERDEHIQRFVPLIPIAIGLGKIVGKALISWGVGKLFNSIFKKPDKQKEYTQQILNAVGRNYDAINRNYQEIRNLQKRVEVNTMILVDVHGIVSDTRSLVQEMMERMQENFNRVLESLRDMKVAPIATGINNFINYFVGEKEMVSRLSDEEFLAKAKQANSFLFYLKQSRSPNSDSLGSYLFAILHQNLAVPRDPNDSVAFSALEALFYGTQTYASVMLFLLDQYLRLAALNYRNGNLDEYNDNLDSLRNIFKSFQNSLVGDSSVEGQSLFAKVIEVMRTVRDECAIKKCTGDNSNRVLSSRLETLSQLKTQLDGLSLPVIWDVPGKISGGLSFPQPGISTPVGDWRDGASVQYAVQFRHNGTHSKIGEWSSPMTVSKRACPVLRIPVDPNRRERLVFRRFNRDRPVLVGVLESKYQTEFRDVDRDLYNAALNYDSDAGARDAKILVANGANASAVFENGRRAIHAAAQSNNVLVAKDFLLIQANSTQLDAKDDRGYTPLHVAAEAGSDAIIDLLIEKGADVNRQTLGEKLTPLHVATYTGFDSTVAALLKSKGIDVNARDANGFTPLHSAVFGGDVVLKTLLSRNDTDPNARSDAGMTPLHLASINNFVDIVESLLKHENLDFGVGAKGNLTALHFASMVGHAEMVKKLSGLPGVEVNSESILGWTPLHLAVSLQKEEVAAELLKCSRTSVNAAGENGASPLHLAALTGQTSVMESLVKNGADVGGRTKDGMTAMHYAAMQGNTKAISVLLAKGAKVDSTTVNGLTPLHLAAASPSSDLQTIKHLIRNRASLKTVPDTGETGLHLAARGGVLEVVKYFHGLGQGVNAQDKAGRRPLHLAAGAGRLEALQYLLEKGATAGLTSSRETLLHYAAFSGHLGLVRVVAANETNVDSKDKNGYTPLYVAFKNEHPDVLRYLVEAKNADVNLKYDKGDTILHSVSSSGDIDVVDFLARNGADGCAVNDRGFSPLVSAAEKGHLPVVKHFVEERNLALDSLCHFIARPITASQGHLDLVKYLGLQSVADRKISGPILSLNQLLSLHTAVQNGHLDVIELLLQEGVNFDTAGQPSKASSAPENGFQPTIMHKPFISFDGLYGPYLKEYFAHIPLKEIETKNFDSKKLSSILGQVLFFAILKALPNVLPVSDEIIKSYIYTFFTVTAGKRNYNAAKLIVENKIADVNFQPNGSVTMLHLLAFDGDLNLIRYLVESRHANIDVEDDKGMTPLLRAIQGDNFEVMEYLVGKGAKLVSSKKISALSIAAANGNRRMCEFLLGKGADINIKGWGFTAKFEEFLAPVVPDSLKTSFEGTVLSNAVSYGHLDLVKYLKEKGADVNACDLNETTPLQVAAMQGRLDIVKYLVEECHAKLDAKNKMNKNPFRYAVESGNVDVVKYIDGLSSNSTFYPSSFNDVKSVVLPGHEGVLKYLIDKKYSFKDELLFDAADHGNLAAVKYLVANGASVNYREKGWIYYDRTALHFAADSGRLDVVKYLVEEQHADVDVKESYSWTPVHYAARHGHLDVVKYLVGVKKAKPDIEGTDKNTPLSTALTEGHKAVAEYLAGLSGVSCRSDKLNECLGGAIECNMLNMVKNLVQRGANVTMHLEKAFSNPQLDIAKFLVEKGAKLNARLSNNATVIHLAAKRGDLSMVQLLVKKGAYKAVEDGYEMTPAQVAKLFCNSAVADFLESGRFGPTPRYLPCNHLLHSKPPMNLYQIHLKMPRSSGGIADQSDNKSRTKHLPDAINSTHAHDSHVDEDEALGEINDHSSSSLTSNEDLKNILSKSRAIGESSMSLSPDFSDMDNFNIKNRATSLDDSNKFETADRCKSPTGCSEQKSWFSTIAHYVVDALSRLGPSPTIQPTIGAEQATFRQTDWTPTQETDPHSTLFLLDVLVRKRTGQKYVGGADRGMPAADATKIATDVAGKFIRVLQRAATRSRVSPHRLDIDVAEVISVVGRKLMGGNFRDIARELRSLVVKACPETKPGCPGRLGKRRFEAFVEEVEAGLEVILDQVAVEVVRGGGGRPESREMKRQKMAAVERGGYIGHTSVQIPGPQVGNDRRQKLLY